MRPTSIDKLAWTYSSAVVLLVLSTQPARWAAVIVAHLGVMVVAAVLSSVGRGSRVIRFVRCSYPLWLLALGHYESGLTNQLVWAGFFDEMVSGWSAALFGPNPLDAWRGRRWLDEVMSFSYVTFYLWIVLLSSATWIWRRSRMEEMVSCFALCMYGLFLAHRLFPVVGPTELRAVYFPAASAGLFGTITDTLFDRGDTPGGAFPSAHCAGVVVLWGYLWRLFGRASALFTLPAVIALCLSTVYLSIHYAVDSVAGVVVGFVVLEWGPRLNSRWRASEMVEGGSGSMTESSDLVHDPAPARCTAQDM